VPQPQPQRATPSPAKSPPLSNGAVERSPTNGGGGAGGASASAAAPRPAVPSGPWRMPCFNCQSVTSPESMMLCDGCSRSFHVHCVSPRFAAIPTSPWFCRKCRLRVVECVGEQPDVVELEAALGRGLNAPEKVARGRVAASFDIVSYLCDRCERPIQGGSARWRCLTCGEFDLCEKCKSLACAVGDHRPAHAMALIRVPLASLAS